MGGRYTPPKRAIYLASEIPDDAPPRIKEGLARRHLVATTGRCPCGARLIVPDLAPGTVTTVRVEHEDGCPAVGVDQ